MKKVLLISFIALVFLALIAIKVEAADLPEPQDGIITLTEDVKLENDATAQIVVPSDKTITLDLNGHTITAASGKVAITNNGTLTITGEGNVIANGNYAVLNHGELLTINGGNYSKTTPTATQSLISNGWYTNTDNTSGEMSNLVINGGSFNGESYVTVKNDSYGILTINGGTFESTNTKAGIHEVGNGITINGGAFNAIVYVQNYTSVNGVNKEVHFNGGIFNDAVKCVIESGSKAPKSPNVKVYVEENVAFNSDFSLSNTYSPAGTNVYTVERFDVKRIGGSLTFGGSSKDYKMPYPDLAGITIEGNFTLSHVGPCTINNVTVNGTNGIMTGSATIVNTKAKLFRCNATESTITFGEGTSIDKIKETSNQGCSIIVDGGSIGLISSTGSTPKMGYDSITINSGSVESIETSKGNITVNGGEVELITILDKHVTKNPITVTVLDEFAVDTIDNQREGDNSATVDTIINLPSICTIGENGKVLIDLSTATIANINNKYTYAGNAVVPNPTVTLKGKVLVEDTDYTVTYKNNEKAGKTTIEINGKDNFIGTITKTFKIIPKATTLSAKSQSKTAIQLKWNKSEGATGYEVYMATSKNGKFSKVTTVNGDGTVTFKKSGLKVATNYYFKIRPFVNIDGDNYFGEYSSVFATSTATKTPKLKVKTGNERATLTWDKIPGATGYVIYMSESKDGEYKKIKTITSGKTTKYVKKGLEGNKKYYFKIRAYKKVDGKKVYSGYSSIKSVKIQKMYKVVKGDNLTRLSKRFSTTIKNIVKLNKIKDPNLIFIGQILRIF